MTDHTNDNPQLSLGGVIANLPAVRAAKKANVISRIHRRLIEPIETDQDSEPRLSFQQRFFVKPGCRTGTPATTCDCGSGDKVQCCSRYKPVALPILPYDKRLR